MNEIAERDKLDVLHPGLNTKPRVYYRNLYRFTECFVGGTVLADIEDVTECVEGAEVTLSQNQKVLQRIPTDEFGDFKFDQLKPGSGEYELSVRHQKFGSALTKIMLENESVYIGSLTIQ
jgi:hypothetical protein